MTADPNLQCKSADIFPAYHPFLWLIKKTAYNKCYQKLGSSSNQVQIAAKLIPSLLHM